MPKGSVFIKGWVELTPLLFYIQMQTRMGIRSDERVVENGEEIPSGPGIETLMNKGIHIIFTGVGIFPLKTIRRMSDTLPRRALESLRTASESRVISD